MLPELLNVKKTVGVKQSKRAIKENNARMAYIAADAEESLVGELTDLCAEHGVPAEFVPRMDELGRACGIDVSAAVVVVLKD